jgi:hypothetical protein
MPYPAPIFAAILLLVALAPLPYSGYMIVRSIATVVLVWAAVAAAGKGQKMLTATLAVLAIVLNPLIKFRLPREAWMAVDVVGAVVLLAAARRLR